jgi:plasmid maintenance system killer protein
MMHFDEKWELIFNWEKINEKWELIFNWEKINKESFQNSTDRERIYNYIDPKQQTRVRTLPF